MLSGLLSAGRVSARAFWRGSGLAADMPAYRCSEHSETLWPTRPEFARCPEDGCGKQTGRVARDPNATASEISHGLFADYLRRNGRLEAA